MTDLNSEREVPKGEQRKQILIPEVVRDYISDQAGTQRTYSEQVEQWLPTEPVLHALNDDDMGYLKATPALHARIDTMYGKRVKPGQVVSFYAMLAAARNGDAETAAEFAEFVPEVMWEIMAEVDQ